MLLESLVLYLESESNLSLPNHDLWLLAMLLHELLLQEQFSSVISVSPCEQSQAPRWLFVVQSGSGASSVCLHLLNSVAEN